MPGEIAVPAPRRRWGACIRAALTFLLTSPTWQSGAAPSGGLAPGLVAAFAGRQKKHGQGAPAQPAQPSRPTQIAVPCKRACPTPGSDSTAALSAPDAGRGTRDAATGARPVLLHIGSCIVPCTTRPAPWLVFFPLGPSMPAFDYGFPSGRRGTPLFLKSSSPALAPLVPFCHSTGLSHTRPLPPSKPL